MLGEIQTAGLSNLDRKPNTSDINTSVSSTAVTQISGNGTKPGPHEIIRTIVPPSHEYFVELFKKKRGTPLWWPAPSPDLPLAYRRSGIDVGDVGIVNLEGPFEFLFNILRPSDHPINFRGVPESFQPLTGCDILHYQCDHQMSRVIGCSDVRYVHVDPYEGLTFESTSSTGAILILPQGSIRREIKNLENIRGYMTPSTLESWYEFAWKRGLQLKNGDIILVHKCDKTSSWGIATFSTIQGQTASFTFKKTDGSEALRPTYEWISHGTANVQMRTGPAPDENWPFLHNQCVFLNSFRPIFSPDRWRKLERKLGVKGAGSSHGEVQHPTVIEGASRQPPTGTKQGKLCKPFCLRAVNACEGFQYTTFGEGYVFSDPLQIRPGQSYSLISRFSSFSKVGKAIKAATNSLREYHSSQQKQCLSEAIIHYRHAYESSNKEKKQFLDIAITYAGLLSKQDRLCRGKSNIALVIRILEEARGVMEKRSSQQTEYGALLNSLSQAYLDRYRMSKSSQDFEVAMSTFSHARSHNRSFPVSPNYATSLIGSAIALWTACELEPQDRGNLAKLKEALDLLEIAQGRDDINIQVECHRQFALIYDLLYTKTANRVHLDLSITHYARASIMLHPESLNRTLILFNLAKQHFERHKLTTDVVDLAAAEQRRDEVKKLINQLPEAKEFERRIQDLADHMYFHAEFGAMWNPQARLKSDIGQQTSRGSLVRQICQQGQSAGEKIGNSLPGQPPVAEPTRFAQIGYQCSVGQAFTTEPTSFHLNRHGTLASVNEDTGYNNNRTLAVQPEISQQTRTTGSYSGHNLETRCPSAENNVQSLCAVLGQTQVAQPPCHQEPIVAIKTSLDTARDEAQKLVKQLDDLKGKLAVVANDADLYKSGSLSQRQETILSDSQVKPVEFDLNHCRVNRDQAHIIGPAPLNSLHQRGSISGASTPAPTSFSPCNGNLPMPVGAYNYMPMFAPWPVPPPVIVPPSQVYNIYDYSRHETSYGRFYNQGESVVVHGSGSTSFVRNTPHDCFNDVNHQLNHNEQMRANNYSPDNADDADGICSPAPQRSSIYDIETEDDITNASSLPFKLPRRRAKGLFRSDSV